MLYIASSPRVYRRLQREVDDAVARGVVAPGEIISDSALRGMPYPQAIIKESVRIHPPATDQLPKKVPAEGDTVTIDGKKVFLPGGTNVSYDFWGLHHSKKIFGEDAEEYRPERWLFEEVGETDPERIRTMMTTHELIFGYGRYQCLGKPVAIMEIGKALFEVSFYPLPGSLFGVLSLGLTYCDNSCSATLTGPFPSLKQAGRRRTTWVCL